MSGLDYFVQTALKNIIYNCYLFNEHFLQNICLGFSWDNNRVIIVM